MWSRACLLGTVLGVCQAGCVDGTKTSLVPSSNPFDKAGMGPFGTKLPPESEALAIRVATIGQRVVAANKDANLQPCFMMIGSPKGELEIFHRGTQEVLITEALAQRCTSDGQLAAVLSYELARISAEREAEQRFSPASFDRPPPIDVRVGSDYSMTYGGSDLTRTMEMARLEKEARQRQEQSSNPELRAQLYLQKAGYPRSLLAEVAPLLKSAESRGTLEKQLNPRANAAKAN